MLERYLLQNSESLESFSVRTPRVVLSYCARMNSVPVFECSHAFSICSSKLKIFLQAIAPFCRNEKRMIDSCRQSEKKRFFSFFVTQSLRGGKYVRMLCGTGLISSTLVLVKGVLCANGELFLLLY